MRKSKHIFTEFHRLKKKFGLPNSLNLDIRRQRSCIASYEPVCWRITLPDVVTTPMNLYCLLHELCHAIQWHEHRAYKYHIWDELWKYELEAYEFADKQYTCLYQYLYGPVERIDPLLRKPKHLEIFKKRQGQTASLRIQTRR